MDGWSASVARVVLSCLLTCGLLWGLSWWLRRTGRLPGTRQGRLRLLDGLPLGGGRFLLLVACDERQFLLAVTPGQVQLVAELDSPQRETEGARDDGHGAANGARHDGAGASGRKGLWQLGLPLALLAAVVAVAHAQSPTVREQLSVGPEAVRILLVLTLLALAPFLLAVMTCFTRIVIVLSLLRMALGTPQTPPNPVLIGMALFLTLFVMAPTLQEAHERGLQPLLRGEIGVEQAIAAGYRPFQRFMLRQVRQEDLALFLRLARLPNPKTPDEVPAVVLIPAFVLSEVRTGFEIGFLLSVPFLVVDLVVASVLMGLGMLMVPPMLLSLPLKLLLFVLADGWHLLMRGLALSVR